MTRDFQLPRVKSINASGHKFGLVYAGLGWIIWRDRSYLPSHLIFELRYLGGTEESYTLNFSRPGYQVIGQYYNFVRLGFDGYREIMENCLANARLLSKALERTGWFTCVSDIHRKKGDFTFKGVKEVFHSVGETSANYNPGLPVVAFRFSDDFKKNFPHIKQDSISILLRAKQYIIPSKLRIISACFFPPFFFSIFFPLLRNQSGITQDQMRADRDYDVDYPLPPKEEKGEILRAVVRESMAADLIDRLVADIVAVTEKLMVTEPVDLAALQTPPTGIERRLARAGYQREQAKKVAGPSKKPASKGIHGQVC
jgi:glutamate decarboxylase